MIRNRREIIGALAASGAVLASTPAHAPIRSPLDLAQIKKDTDVACLYHCDFGDPQRFSQMLQNMLNHYSAYEFDTFKLKLVVVAHGRASSSSSTTAPERRGRRTTSIRELYQRFVGLTKYGVEGYLCQITYKRLNIDPAKTRKDAFLQFVPSGVATVAELQSQGLRLSEGRVKRGQPERATSSIASVLPAMSCRMS